MESSLWLEAILILILVIANGLFSSSEIAIVSARRGRLEQGVVEGDKNAQIALELQRDPDRFLSTVQVGITLIGTLAAAFGGDRFAEPLANWIISVAPSASSYAHGIALTVVVLIISYLSLILGELVPKRLALQSPEALARAVAPWMSRISGIAAPIVWFLSASTSAVLRLLGRNNVQESSVTEEDVLALVREGTAGGTLEAAEQELISSVFSFTDRSVRALMTPRTQVVAAEIDTPLAEVVELITESGYSRLPIYRESLDQIEGVLYAKDLLRAQGHDDAVTLASLLRPPTYLLESQKAVAAFQQLRQSHSAMAIVLDEYGQVAGLISMEDMLEELVGDIDDEYDERVEAIVEREDGSYLVDGLVSFTDVRERLNLQHTDALESEHGFETIAGFILALLGRIPRVGDVVEWQGYAFEVVDMDGRRIDRILIRKLPANVATN